MKMISYAKLQKDYAGEYIGRKNNRIIAHAKTYPSLVKQLTKKHIDRKTLTIGFVPPKSTLCAFMRAEFPLNQKHTELGAIPDPVVPTPVLTVYGYQRFDFLLDTGADCSIMPKSVAKDLGIKLSTLPTMRFCGIEGRGIAAHLGRITVRITDAPVEITCAFSSNEKSPFILGRKDIFSVFNIEFDNRSKIIRFVRFRP